MKPIPNNFKQVVLALFVSASAVTSAYALVAGPPSAAPGNDAGCPNTSTKTGVYAPCVGYLPPTTSFTTPPAANGVHHLSSQAGIVVPSMNTQQAAAKGLLPKALGTPSFGVMVAVSEGGGAGQQNPNSAASTAQNYCGTGTNPPLGTEGWSYLDNGNLVLPQWSGWDNLNNPPQSSDGWIYSCHFEPQPTKPCSVISSYDANGNAVTTNYTAYGAWSWGNGNNGTWSQPSCRQNVQPPRAKPTCPSGQTQTAAPQWNGSSWVGQQCSTPSPGGSGGGSGSNPTTPPNLPQGVMPVLCQGSAAYCILPDGEVTVLNGVNDVPSGTRAAIISGGNLLVFYTKPIYGDPSHPQLITSFEQVNLIQYNGVNASIGQGGIQVASKVDSYNFFLPLGMANPSEISTNLSDSSVSLGGGYYVYKDVSTEANGGKSYSLRVCGPNGTCAAPAFYQGGVLYTNHASIGSTINNGIYITGPFPYSNADDYSSCPASWNQSQCMFPFRVTTPWSPLLGTSPNSMSGWFDANVNLINTDGPGPMYSIGPVTGLTLNGEWVTPHMSNTPYPYVDYYQYHIQSQDVLNLFSTSGQVVTPSGL